MQLHFFLPQSVTLNTPQNLCSFIRITREEVYILLSDSETAINAQYCVARAGADPAALAIGLSWACGPGGANCIPIQPGQVCYVANNLTAIASYAYNDYYQRTKATGGTCNFNNTATTTSNNPSNYSDSFLTSVTQWNLNSCPINWIFQVLAVVSSASGEFVYRFCK